MELNFHTIIVLKSFSDIFCIIASNWLNFSIFLWLIELFQLTNLNCQVFENLIFSWPEEHICFQPPTQ